MGFRACETRPPILQQPGAWRSACLSGAKAIERDLEDWFDVVEVAVDCGYGDEHVKDLFEREIVTDLVGALCGGEERSPGGEYPSAALAEDRVTPVRVGKQLSGDVALSDREGKEPTQPDHQRCSRRLAVTLGSPADGIDFVGEQSLKELTTARKVAVKRRHPDTSASRYLGHRHRRFRISERGAGSGEDTGTIARGVSAFFRR